ncbi:MAG TPA: hypothetical protein VNV25_25660 [Gemmatimonadaceae bacterium]|jgi:hypothetical protein|nr:hypothetical protein [Gemmatimonadaceae bacterium]
MSFSTVTCAYTINASGQMTPAQLAASMAAADIPIPVEFLELTGATVTSDTTAAGATSAARTVVFNITAAQFQSQFPDDPLGPFWGLLTLPIAEYVNAPVLEALPVAA